MRIGFLGLGKLGLPVALTAEKHGHEIVGTDIARARREQISDRTVPEQEPHVHGMLERTRLQLWPTTKQVVAAEPEIIFVCVQTPHEPEFEGCVPVTRPPQDFSYRALQQALHELHAAEYAELTVIVSTCLPGTVDRLNTHELNLAYNPLFIAMGSVVEDYEHPEFVLVGHPTEDCPPVLRAYYDSTVTVGTPVTSMAIRSAELTKVAYNAAIGFKLLLANTIAEVCDRTGANADDVMDTLKTADKRLVSAAYMTPGMGDGGGCHPRDQIAMSWLADNVGLSHNPFETIVQARESHAQWLADTWVDEADRLPLVMLGESYKPDTYLTTGSPARLVEHYARARGRRPLVSDYGAPAGEPACYFVATPHEWVLRVTPPKGSVVVDPWGVFPEQDGVRLVRPGRR